MLAKRDCMLSELQQRTISTISPVWASTKGNPVCLFMSSITFLRAAVFLDRYESGAFP